MKRVICPGREAKFESIHTDYRKINQREGMNSVMNDDICDLYRTFWIEGGREQKLYDNSVSYDIRDMKTAAKNLIGDKCPSLVYLCKVCDGING